MFQRCDVLLVVWVIVNRESVGVKDTVGVFLDNYRRLARPRTAMETRAGRVLGIEQEVVNDGKICSELASDEVDERRCVVGVFIMRFRAVSVLIGLMSKLTLEINVFIRLSGDFTTWSHDNVVRDRRRQVGDGGWEMGHGVPNHKPWVTFSFVSPLSTNERRHT